jgi:predicted secreted protein
MRKYFFSLIVLVIFFFGCTESSMLTAPRLNSSINGKSINILRNQKFLLDLDVHSDGGYEWDCQLRDSKVIKKDSTQIISKNKNVKIMGGISVETFYFSGNNVTGESEITLIEHRSWEKDIPPVNKVQFHVIVK